MQKLKDRFLKYISLNTQSDEKSESYPSTPSQLEMMALLRAEMEAIGLSDVTTDKYGYTMATIPASEGCELAPVVGFIAHVDTSPDMSGENIRPKIVECYRGEEIELNPTTTMSVEQFAELESFKGHTIIHTDGTTLLGADDKAGVAEIITAAEHLINHPEIKHGKIRIAFTPDEEVGRGVDFFDLRSFGADFAYTVDGSMEGEIEYENFNAASAKVVIKGVNIHPGYAKDKMVNALDLACQFNTLLPAAERPQYTQGYEGFFHLVGVQGDVERAELNYIIRDHDAEEFEKRKLTLWHAVGLLRQRYTEESVELIIKDQYRNMKEMITPHPQLIDKACEAMRMAGVTPIIKPIRGGTDGARLSFMGLPCPNLFTGGINFHGRYECASLNTMQRSVDVIVNLAQLWAQ
ncbi:MAG: peptidase T [Rikenellaceae bacterium]